MTTVDLDVYGTFHEEQTLAVGDPFTKQSPSHQRHTGKQFGIVGCTTPKESPLGLHIPYTIPGDRYIEPSRMQHELAKRINSHASNGVHGPGKAFVPSSGRTLSSGPGSLFGTFGPPHLLVDIDASTSGRRPDTAPVRTSKRNIYVNPPHAGGPGRMVQDNTIGGTKFDHIPDEYCRGRRLEKDMKREARARIAKPFIGTGGPPRIFKDISALAATPGDPSRVRASTAPLKSTIWRPANPPVKGPGHGTINKLEYVASPEITAKFHARDAKALKPFKPIGGAHHRLSMWTVNPYVCDARPAPDNSLSLL